MPVTRQFSWRELALPAMQRRSLRLTKEHARKGKKGRWCLLRKLARWREQPRKLRSEPRQTGSEQRTKKTKRIGIASSLLSIDVALRSDGGRNHRQANRVSSTVSSATSLFFFFLEKKKIPGRPPAFGSLRRSLNDRRIRGCDLELRSHVSGNS